MSNYVASESKNDYETNYTSGKRDGKDEGGEDGDEIIEGTAAENPTTLTTVSTVPSTNDQFMHKPEFRRHFVEFVHVQTLMALRFTTKAWKAVAEEVIDEGVASGAMMVHDGKDISIDAAWAQHGRRKLISAGGLP